MLISVAVVTVCNVQMRVWFVCRKLQHVCGSNCRTVQHAMWTANCTQRQWCDNELTTRSRNQKRPTVVTKLLSRFQTFAVLWMLYSFFWVIPRLLDFMEQSSETSAHKLQTPGYHPKERIQQNSFHWWLLIIQYCSELGAEFFLFYLNALIY